MGNLGIGDRQRKTLVKIGNLGKVGGIFSHQSAFAKASADKRRKINHRLARIYTDCLDADCAVHLGHKLPEVGTRKHTADMPKAYQ
ncbi:MAG: hypothetical protein PHY02_07180 [Phycisphaerae bacterium]|nr:hypothetical protein [Phycisphaerae bacterium]